MSEPDVEEGEEEEKDMAEDKGDSSRSPMTPGATTNPTFVTNITPVKMTPSGKRHAVSFTNTASLRP